MKILQVIPTLNIGGAEILCENLSTELVRQGHDVTIACLFNCTSPITERLTERNIPIRFLGKKPGLDFRMIRKLRNVINEENPDAIHVHLSMLKYVVPALKGRKIPVVYTFHTIAQCDSGKLDRLYNQYCFKNGIVVPVALSESVKDTVVSEYQLSSDEVKVIYNGVPLSNIEQKTDNDSDSLNIICAARFSPPKNHLRMVRVFRKIVDVIPQAKLTLAGDGETMPEVKAEVERLKLNNEVEFLGMVSNIKEILHNYDVFWLTSDYEGMPLSIIEAMAAGLPVVATAVGGIPNMIEDGVDGILTEIDEDNICNAILSVYHNPFLRTKLSKMSIEKSKQYSIEKTTLSYIKYYDKPFIR